MNAEYNAATKRAPRTASRRKLEADERGGLAYRIRVALADIRVARQIALDARRNVPYTNARIAEIVLEHWPHPAEKTSTPEHPSEEHERDPEPIDKIDSTMASSQRSQGETLIWLGYTL
jgi:hypothetical protein